MDPFLLIAQKAMLLQNVGYLHCPLNMGYKQWLQQWVFYNTRKFKFTMKRLHSGWPCLLREDLEFLELSSLVRSFGYLPQILFVHIYMIEPLVYACKPLQGWKSLGIGYDLIYKQRGCFSPRINHRCCVNRMDRTQSRAQLFDTSKRVALQMETRHFPLDTFLKAIL